MILVVMPSAKLHHTSDNQPGFTRKFVGDKFVFYNQRGRLIKSQRIIKRCESLGIPPAYIHVWVTPDPHGHLQATAHDDRGRKQYFYHPVWRSQREVVKYEQLLPFARILGSLRRSVAQDLALPGIPKAKVVATLVKLLDTTYIRVGNEEYAHENKSYGLTTLLRRHVHGRGSDMKFIFRGKSGVRHELSIKDKRIRKIVAACQDLPGQTLFEYLDDLGDTHSVRSDDVNAYLQTTSQIDITAKDFRTWHGTVLFNAYLSHADMGTTAADRKKTITAALKDTALALGNTVAICRKCYIHPRLFKVFMNGELKIPKRVRGLRRRYPGLRVDELKLVSLLEKW